MLVSSKLMVKNGLRTCYRPLRPGGDARMSAASPHITTYDSHPLRSSPSLGLAPRQSRPSSALREHCVRFVASILRGTRRSQCVNAEAPPGATGKDGHPLPQKPAEAVNTTSNPTFATISAKTCREQLQ